MLCCVVVVVEEQIDEEMRGKVNFIARKVDMCETSRNKKNNPLHKSEKGVVDK